MNEAAIVTFVVVAGIVWGGFALILWLAMRREAAKQAELDTESRP